VARQCSQIDTVDLDGVVAKQPAALGLAQIGDDFLKTIEDGV